MTTRIFMTATLAAVLAAPVFAPTALRAQDASGGLPAAIVAPIRGSIEAIAKGFRSLLPGSAEVRDESFKGIIFETGNATTGRFTLTLSPGGGVTVRSPGKPTITGKATAAEIEAIRHWNLSEDDLRRSNPGKERVWGQVEPRYQVLSKLPYSIRVTKKDPAILNTYRFDNNGQPSDQTGSLRLADALNGLVDRLTGGAVYGAWAMTIEGTLEADPVRGYTVTDDRGNMLVLDRSGMSPYSSAVTGGRISVTGVLSEQVLTDTYHLRADGTAPSLTVAVISPTRPVVVNLPKAPAAALRDRAPRSTGLTGALDAARVERR